MLIKQELNYKPEMETQYQVGQVYDLRFLSTIVKDGAQYIVATDGGPFGSIDSTFPC